MAEREEKEELYEIVPTDAYSGYSARSEHLDKEIEEIKNALKSAVGLAKVEANAQTIITQMLDMVNVSQKLVEQVATANQQLAQKVQEALDRMNETNAALSEKLGTILDTFAQASESMDEAPDETTQAVKNLADTMGKIAQQNSRMTATLESIEKNLRRSAVRAPPMMQSRPRPRPMQRYPQQSEEEEQSFDDELPPPPFPP